MSRRTPSSKGTLPASIPTRPETEKSLPPQPLPPRPAALSTLRALQLADYITLLNGFSGFMSILSSMRYCLSQTHLPTDYSGSLSSHSSLGSHGSPSSIYFALSWIPLGLFFDFMDGRVARWQGKGEGSALGQELDSLADLVSFGVAPACAAFALGMRTMVDSVVLSFFVLCGLLRLARFNVSVGEIPKDSKGKSRYFEGLPIPTSLGIVAGMVVLCGMGLVGGKLPGGVLGEGTAWEVHTVGGVFLGWGCLMLSRRLRVPKP